MLNIENLIENIESIIECASAIESDAKDNVGEEVQAALGLYRELVASGSTTDPEDIQSALNLYEELYADGRVLSGRRGLRHAVGVHQIHPDAAMIRSALELWDKVDEPDFVEAAMEIYETVVNGFGVPSSMHSLTSRLDIAEEWAEHCGHTWEDPESMAQGFREQCNIVAVFDRVTGRSILSVEDAEKCVSLVGSLTAKEQALLDAIKAFCEPNAS